jgi:hypothetical protein
MQREAPFGNAALKESFRSESGGWEGEKDKTVRQLCSSEEEEIIPTHQELAVPQ